MVESEFLAGSPRYVSEHIGEYFERGFTVKHMTSHGFFLDTINYLKEVHYVAVILEKESDESESRSST
jgi:hypothetical protein